MADVHNKEIRSFNMSRIRSKNTKPELLVRSALFSNGFRYRIHVKNLPGKPDIVLSKYHTVIFVNGCFWHGHEGCRYFKMPKTDTKKWEDKIASNRRNDLKMRILLKDSGWNCIDVFECELKKGKLEITLTNLFKLIKGNQVNA